MASKARTAQVRELSRAHRETERQAVKTARYYLKHRNYRQAIHSLLIALEQSTAADVKEAWWKRENWGSTGGRSE